MTQIPIILLTGFLGSGKTTFLNWIITQNPNTKISVIVNEFGTIKLESQFIKNASGDVIELANGCMCCMAKSDIPRTIRLILEHSPQTEYILIEASGLSDPDPIKETLLSESLAAIVYLHSTICIVDALHFLDTYLEHPLILSQAADSDAIIFSKITNASEKQFEQTKNIVATNIPDTPQFEWGDNMSFEEILGSRKRLETPVVHHHLHEVYEQHWFISTSAQEKEKIEKTFHSLPKSVYRAKGAVQFVDGSAALLSYVSGTLTFEDATTPIQGTTILFLSDAKLPDDFDQQF